MLISRVMNAARFGGVVVSALALACGCGAKSSLADAAMTSTTTTGGTGGGHPTSSSSAGSGGGGAPSLCMWSERFGDAKGQYVTSMAVDPANAIYLAGYFRGTIDLGDQTLDSQSP